SQTTNENDRIATLFMHGYGGTENSEKFIVNQAKKKGVTDTIVTSPHNFLISIIRYPIN
ncbi:hypothetical protein BUY47_12190, partial [Staphylococcus devriesei]